MATPKPANKTEWPTVGTRYPAYRVRLLDAIREKRGDESRSATVAHALDLLIQEHFPHEKKAA